MQAFKLENYLRANPGAAPPPFRRLTDSEANALFLRLVAKAGKPTDNPRDLLQSLVRRSTPVPGVNLEEDEVELCELFRLAGVVPGPELYVEWGPFREIDRFETNVLNRHFYDVWYPSSDDIEIFDETMNWLLFVRHYGGVEVWCPQ